MATLTIRNLPQAAHDALRRIAAENRNSMEAEARAALVAHVARKSPDEVKRRVRQLQAKLPRPPAGAKADGVDASLAEKRIDVLFEEGLISLDEKLTWEERINRYEVSLDEVQAYFDRLWPWSKPATS